MYSAQITRANPTCIVFLIDQSGSMADPAGADNNERKADFVADVVNHALHDIVIRCTKTEEIRNYYDIGIIGYGRSVGSLFDRDGGNFRLAPISEIANNPLAIQTKQRRISNGDGGWVEMPVRVPIWIKPAADGLTPMCEALSSARSILEPWVRNHQKSFPPTILHLTDGESSDGDPLFAGKQILDLKTEDGSALLFNCHISSSSRKRIEYPPTQDSLPDQFARTLFNISSELPVGFLAAAEQLGVKAQRGSRGFVFNGDPSSVVQFYEIGTSLTGMTPYKWMQNE